MAAAAAGETTATAANPKPTDILYHIHSLLPLRDAARAACVSRVFLNSWRCRPNMYFSTKTLGLKPWDYKTPRDFTNIVYHILKKHSGIGLKTFQLEMYGCYKINSCHLDNWLELALTLGVEELILATASMTSKYNFPLSLLSGKCGNSIRYLRLSPWVFRPTVRLGWFRSLKRLHLYFVSITGDELGCLLRDSVALEQLELAYCEEIISFPEYTPCVAAAQLPEGTRDLRAARLITGDVSHLRQMPEQRYVKLKCVRITGFYPAKSLLELVSHILETATSLECLTLGTTYCSCRRRRSDPAKCYLVAIK